jgi:hypothetical protein
MAKSPVRAIQEADVASRAKELFPLLDKLAATLKSDTRIFPSGIELFKLTLKAGSDYEFSIVIAGKDAPKADVLVPDQK